MQERKGSVLAPVKPKFYPKLESAPQLGGEGSGFPPRYCVATGQHNHIVLGVDLGSRNIRVAALENDEVDCVLPTLCTTLVLTHTGYWGVARDARDASPSLQHRGVFRDSRARIGTQWHRSLGGEHVDGEVLTRLLLFNMLKQVSQNRAGALRDVVLTVPASFSSMERKQIRSACEMLDLQVVQLINEPTAAILAYCHHNKVQQGNFLIFHMGASSCAATVYNFTNGIIEIRATSADHTLGSNAIDDLLIQHFCQQFEKEYKCRPLMDEAALQLLETAAVNIKEGLANSNFAYYQIHGLKLGENNGYRSHAIKFAQSGTSAPNLSQSQNAHASGFLACEVSRDLFKTITGKVAAKMLMHVQKAYMAAQVAPRDLTRVLVSGQGTQLFSIMEELAEIPCQNGIFCLDEYMPAKGAALQAGLVCQAQRDLIIWDLLTQPIFLVGEGERTQVIAKNTPLPVTAYVRVPIKDNTVNIKLMQGHATLTAIYTDIVINNCPPSLEAQATLGDKQVELAIRVSHDGLITYAARHLGLGVALLVTPLADRPREYIEGIERHLDRRTPGGKESDDKIMLKLAHKLNLPLYSLGEALTALGFSPEQISSGEAVYLALHDLKSVKKKARRKKNKDKKGTD